MQLVGSRKDEAEANALKAKLQKKFPKHEFVTKPGAGSDLKVEVWAVRAGGPDFTSMRNLAQEID